MFSVKLPIALLTALIPFSKPWPILRPAFSAVVTTLLIPAFTWPIAALVRLRALIRSVSSAVLAAMAEAPHVQGIHEVIGGPVADLRGTLTVGCSHDRDRIPERERSRVATLDLAHGDLHRFGSLPIRSMTSPAISIRPSYGSTSRRLSASSPSLFGKLWSTMMTSSACSSRST